MKFPTDLQQELWPIKFNKMIYDQVDPINHTFTASIGLSLYPEDGIDATALLNAADLSMYETKQQRSL